MDRIIINEVDNTSNVEGLSSYDVAYVPGFAMGLSSKGVDPTLYRKPTLITDKYQFTNTFGATVPTFQTAQQYPASFPEEAIKWGDNYNTYFPLETDNFSTFADIVDAGTQEKKFYKQQETEIAQVPENTHYYFATFTAATDTTAEHYDLSSIDSDVVETVNIKLSGYTLKSETETTPVEGKVYYLESSGTFTPWVVEITDVADTYYYKNEDGSIYTQLSTETTADSVAGVYHYYPITPTEFTGESFEEGVDYFEQTTPNDSEIVVYIKTQDETPQDGKTYYTIADGSAYQVTFSSDVYYVIDDSAKYPVFYSTINPSEEGWFELGQDTYTETSDTFIVVDNEKVYYIKTDGVPAMFDAGDMDPGYRYALALLSMGMPVYYEQMNQSEDDITVANMYAGLEKRFTVNSDNAEGPTNPDYSFDSMGDYMVKFLTSGGYPTFEYSNNSLAIAMIDLAVARKDAIALIDHTDNPTRPIDMYSETSVISKVRSEFQLTDIQGSCSAMFTPWFNCSNAVVSPYGDEEDKIQSMPGSFAYLTSLATQLLSTNPWLAVSGVTRGRVPYCKDLHTNLPLTNNIADSYQLLPSEYGGYGLMNVSINPITNIRNYGYCIWGNRTLRNNGEGTKALSFLNIRSVVSDIKKRLYETSQQLLFDQNTDVLWLNFKSLITPLLETMKTDYILNDYAITRLTVDPETGAAVPAYKVLAIIRIQPINSVEVFDLTVYLENTEGFVLETAESNEEI